VGAEKKLFYYRGKRIWIPDQVRYDNTAVMPGKRDFSDKASHSIITRVTLHDQMVEAGRSEMRPLHTGAERLNKGAPGCLLWLAMT